MVSLSPKLKILIVVAAVAILGIITTVIAVVVIQKNNYSKIQSLSFVDASISINVGDEIVLDVVIDKKKKKNRDLSFWSDDSDIVEVVSYTNKQVVIKAKLIGETQINVQSLANKKLTDKCTVVVSDFVAEEIICNNSSCFVGKVGSVSIDLNPSTANINKITVLNFDNSHLEYAKIIVENGKASLWFLPKSEGESQIVLGVLAQTSHGDDIVLTKSVVVTSYVQSYSSLRYQVRSNSYTKFVEDNNASNDNFIISSANYSLYFKFYGDVFDNVIDIDNINIIYDDDIIEISRVTVSNQGDLIKVGITGNSNWDTTVVRFQYAEIVRTITLYNLEEDFSTFNISLPNTMTVGYMYQISLDSLSQKLIGAGFATITINANTNVSFENFMIVANNSIASTKLEFVRTIYYWDTTAIAQYNMIIQKDVNVSIKEISFVE